MPKKGEDLKIRKTISIKKNRKYKRKGIKTEAKWNRNVLIELKPTLRHYLLLRTYWLIALTT